MDATLYGVSFMQYLFFIIFILPVTWIFFTYLEKRKENRSPLDSREMKKIIREFADEETEEQKSKKLFLANRTKKEVEQSFYDLVSKLKRGEHISLRAVEATFITSVLKQQIVKSDSGMYYIISIRSLIEFENKFEQLGIKKFNAIIDMLESEMRPRKIDGKFVVSADVLMHRIRTNTLSKDSDCLFDMCLYEGENIVEGTMEFEVFSEKKFEKLLELKDRDKVLRKEKFDMEANETPIERKRRTSLVQMDEKGNRYYPRSDGGVMILYSDGTKEIREGEDKANKPMRGEASKEPSAHERKLDEILSALVAMISSKEDESQKSVKAMRENITLLTKILNRTGKFSNETLDEVGRLNQEAKKDENDLTHIAEQAIETVYADNILGVSDNGTIIFQDPLAKKNNQSSLQEEQERLAREIEAEKKLKEQKQKEKERRKKEREQKVSEEASQEEAQHVETFKTQKTFEEELYAEVENETEQKVEEKSEIVQTSDEAPQDMMDITVDSLNAELDEFMASLDQVQEQKQKKEEEVEEQKDSSESTVETSIELPIEQDDEVLESEADVEILESDALESDDETETDSDEALEQSDEKLSQEDEALLQSLAFKNNLAFLNTSQKYFDSPDAFFEYYSQSAAHFIELLQTSKEIEQKLGLDSFCFSKGNFLIGQGVLLAAFLAQLTNPLDVVNELIKENGADWTRLSKYYEELNGNVTPLAISGESIERGSVNIGSSDASGEPICITFHYFVVTPIILKILRQILGDAFFEGVKEQVRCKRKVRSVTISSEYAYKIRNILKNGS